MKQLGKYEIIELIGKGAYAEVFRAVDTTLDRTVAFKLLKPALLADEDAVSRFMREARAAANLIHPRIAWVWEVGELEGRFYIAMRFIEGQPLDQLLKVHGPLPWTRAQEIVQQIGEALSYAHGRGLVHRDVKPQNVLLSKEEGAVLTDFGLVRAMESSGVGTRTGVLMGTPAYMAPEIWRGENAGPAADQYSLACILSELLTGQQLFGAANTPAVILRHMQPPQLPEQWPIDCPADLAVALHQALNSQPEKRFKCVADFVKTVTASLGVAGTPNSTTVETNNRITSEPSHFSASIISENPTKTEMMLSSGTRPQELERLETRPTAPLTTVQGPPPMGVPVVNDKIFNEKLNIFQKILPGWTIGAFVVLGIFWANVFMITIPLLLTGSWEDYRLEFEGLFSGIYPYGFIFWFSVNSFIGWLSTGISLRKPLKLTSLEVAGIVVGGFFSGGLIPGIILIKPARLRLGDVLGIIGGWGMATSIVFIILSLFSWSVYYELWLAGAGLLILGLIAMTFFYMGATIGSSALGGGIMLAILNAARNRPVKTGG